jgi:hypothetical protein
MEARGRKLNMYNTAGWEIKVVVDGEVVNYTTTIITALSKIVRMCI